MLVINGAYGEGGGQIVRTSLTLAAVLTQPIRIENIRAGRQNPGLAAQHLTAVRAAATICEAKLAGNKLGSTELVFEPQCAPIPGYYEFNVAEARTGGSAGAAALVLQTVLPILASASASSTVIVKGGTHVSGSPSFHYLRDVYLPMLAQLGIEAEVELRAWGWYPAGGGEIKMIVLGTEPTEPRQGLWAERGPLQQIHGIAVAADLPAHIAQRLRDRAVNLLEQAGLPALIEPQRVRSVSPGAGIFLRAEYETSRAGFSSLGQKGKPAEKVAEEAVDDLLAFHKSGALLDQHLADQLILPLALTKWAGSLTVEHISKHTLTNIWAVEQFLGPVAKVDQNNNIIQFRPID